MRLELDELLWRLLRRRKPPPAQNTSEG
jgi:hypothetical protein